MRFCPNCGENIENVPDAVKCPKCGSDIATHLKELEAKEKERVEKDGSLFTEGRYDFALPDQASGLQADAIMGSITEGTETGTGLIKLNPVFKEVVWGGDRLKTVFGYDIPGDNTGECWGISAHPHGDCTVEGGEYDGKTLSWLWKNKPELFGRSREPENLKNDHGSDIFPLLTKIIDAKKDLSVQVHPDDDYARIHENGAKGKTECWYILDCDPGTTIIIGHNAKTREELKSMINNGRWSEFLREIPIKKGDFFQIFPGTVHAIKGGTVILETQENSDVTYRVYDYDRLQNGKLRELHIQQSIDVITVPFDENAGWEKGEPLVGSDNESLVKCRDFHVWHLKCGENSVYQNNGSNYMLCSVIEGEGTLSVVSNLKSINRVPVKKGDHFILTAGFTGFMTTGSFDMICSVTGEEYENS